MGLGSFVVDHPRSRAAQGFLVFVVFVLLPACLPGCGTSDAASSAGSAGCALNPVARATDLDVGTHEFDGVDRTFELVVPNRGNTEPLPLIVNLHGALSDAAHQSHYSRLDKRGPEAGFIVLSPQAERLETFWNVQKGSRDIAYVLDLIDRVEQTQCIDLDHVYATGFSLGGILAMRLACSVPDHFSGIAAVSGTMQTDPCAATDVSLLSIHGRGDPVIEYGGGFDPNLAGFLGRQETPSVPEVVESWATTSGCESEPLRVRPTEHVELVRYSCAGPVRVESFAIDGGDHVWPGANDAVGADTELDATEKIVQFFTDLG